MQNENSNEYIGKLMAILTFRVNHYFIFNLSRNNKDFSNFTRFRVESHCHSAFNSLHFQKAAQLWEKTDGFFYFEWKHIVLIGAQTSRSHRHIQYNNPFSNYPVLVLFCLLFWKSASLSTRNSNAINSFQMQFVISTNRVVFSVDNLCSPFCPPITLELVHFPGHTSTSILCTLNFRVLSLKCITWPHSFCHFLGILHYS